jgi:hypothetical protein
VRRHQLEGERQPIQAVADRRDRGGVLRRQGEVGPHRDRALDEQRRRRGRDHGGGVGRGAVGGQRQRQHRELPLAAQVQRHPAGGEHDQVRAPGQEGGHRRRGVRHLLEIVEHQ